ncbi:MAG: hypothetical protein IT425_10590 [Pirellulales bacterium]|nr:hypothetical protein [Pirellulales bacterium]
MAKKKTRAKRSTDPDALRSQLDQYDEVWGEVARFIALVGTQDAEVVDAQQVVYDTKAKYDAAKEKLAAARDARDGTKHALFMFLRPGPAEILPLFDRMEPASEKQHGKHSAEWRKEPITALRLSLPATNALTASDVLFVGQLQDRVQASEGEGWWANMEGITEPMALAIEDRLNDFIEEHSR